MTNQAFSDNNLDITVVITGADIVAMQEEQIIALFSGLEGLIYASNVANADDTNFVLPDVEEQD